VRHRVETTFVPLHLDRDAVSALLPHRPPLLLVDEVIALGAGGHPALRARYRVCGDEPVLQGHIPGRPTWPGTYTIEGLAQSCALVGGVFVTQPNAWDRSLSLPGAGSPLLASVDVKLTRPVMPPAELLYEVVLTHVVDGIGRFDVEASVGGQSVARGTLLVARASDAT
jgi:3-hydroxyacyl-[acyl-carrier-protein] dehydratase